MATVPKNRRRGSLEAALTRLAGKALGTLEFRLAVEKPDGTLYLMGSPYLWTPRIDKAFVFRSAVDAETIAQEYAHIIGEPYRIVPTRKQK